MRQRFRSIVHGESGRAGWRFITIPFDVLRAFGVSGRVPVRGTINGFPFRGALASVHGVHLLALDARLQRQAGVAGAGDEAEVVLDLDVPPRASHLPPQLREALAGDAAARERFEELPYDHRQEFARWVGSAKKRETKEQRAAQAVQLLKAGRTPS